MARWCFASVLYSISIIWYIFQFTFILLILIPSMGFLHLPTLLSFAMTFVLHEFLYIFRYLPEMSPKKDKWAYN